MTETLREISDIPLRRDIEAMNHRLDELDDEETREIDTIMDRYADVRPHTSAAAVVFALNRADAAGWATSVMDPFHVVALAGLKLDLCRQRIQQQTQGHRGRTGDPLYGVRRTLRTRYPLLSTRQKTRLETVFADENHLSVEVCWGFYQKMIAAYAHPDRRRGKAMMTTTITTLRSGVPEQLEELAQLGRTLWRRRSDVLAYFDHHASNGPTEAINGRLEALRRNALGFRNLTHYRIRSLLHCGNLAHQIDAL